jgi:hypothetical protein
MPAFWFVISVTCLILSYNRKNDDDDDDDDDGDVLLEPHVHLCIKANR